MEVRKSISCSKEQDLEVGHQGFREKYFDYSQRAQWLRAVVLGSNEGLVLSTLFIMGAAQHTHNSDTFLIRGFVGLVAGALTMATSEFVSVYSQVDVVRSQNDRDLRLGKVGALQRAPPPNPIQIAIAASLAYLHGGFVPLLLTWAVKDHVKESNLIFYLAAILATFSMFLTGNTVAILGKTPLIRSFLRVLIGGWIEIGIMLGKMKVFQLYGF